MTVTDWIVASCAVVALGFSYVSDLRSKKANETAAVAQTAAAAANELAEQANELATQANGLAHEANDLAESANSLQAMQSARQTERSHVEWVFYWEADLDRFKARNVGADAARQVTAVVHAKDLHEVGRFEQDIDPGGWIYLPLPRVGDLRREHNQNQGLRAQEMSAVGVLYSGSSFARPASVTITWATTLDAVKSQSGDLRLT